MEPKSKVYRYQTAVQWTEQRKGIMSCPGKPEVQVATPRQPPLFLIASLLAHEPTTNWGMESTVMATRESGHSDSEFPAIASASAWPAAILMTQRQGRSGKR